MKVLFLHGWKSVAGGVKPSFLIDAGHEVINPKLDEVDFDAAVWTAQAEYDQQKPDVIVGSSRGGAVAMNIESVGTPLVLLCPAWKKSGKVKSLKPNSVILHSRSDEVVLFADSEELVKNSRLSPETLIEVGNDHRLADLESLTAMLEACEYHTDKVVGCDFGVPKKAGDQAKKNILIEATHVADKHYAIRPFGRNQRPLRWLTGKRAWPNGRPGWTLPELLTSLSEQPAVRVAAMDFPFGIPQSLLDDDSFSSAVKQAGPFKTRDAWVAFLMANLKFEFSSELAKGEMRDLGNFDSWRTDSRYWKRRASDVAVNGQPPLKHIGQNLFAMTIGGACLLSHLEKTGFNVVLHSLETDSRRSIFETYPSYVATRIGFNGSYKIQPTDCLNKAVAFLKSQGIRLDFDADVKRFCEIYRTGSKKDDPDGADAFLCLVAAICFNEGNRELIRGNATDSQLEQEGGIIVPQDKPKNSQSMTTWQKVQQNPSLYSDALLAGEGEDFHWHTHADAPHSSQVICVSAFGTLRNLAVKNDVIERLLNPTATEVGRNDWTIQLEQEIPELLNENGQGQPTSIDALLTCSEAVFCLEAKFLKDARHGFNSCSQTTPKSKPNCAGHHGVDSDQKTKTKAHCRLEVWDGRRSPRLYWSLGRAFFRDDALAEQQVGETCPFNGPNFQLMRNFLTAAAYAQQHKLKAFGVIVIAPQATSQKLDQQIRSFRTEVLLPEYADHIRLVTYEEFVQLLENTDDEDAAKLACFLKETCLPLATPD